MKTELGLEMGSFFLFDFCFLQGCNAVVPMTSNSQGTQRDSHELSHAPTPAVHSGAYCLLAVVPALTFIFPFPLPTSMDLKHPHRDPTLTHNIELLILVSRS